MASAKVKAAIRLPAGVAADSPHALEQLSDQISLYIDVNGASDVLSAILRMPSTQSSLWRTAALNACLRCSRQYRGVDYIAELYLIPVIISPDQDLPYCLTQGFMEGYAAVFSMDPPPGMGKMILMNRLCTEDMIQNASWLQVHNMLRAALTGNRGKPLDLPESYLREPDPVMLDSPLRYLPAISVRRAGAPRLSQAHLNLQAWLDRLSEFFSAGDARDTAEITTRTMRAARVLAPMRAKNNEAFNAAAFEISRARICMMAGDYVISDHMDGATFSAKLHFDEKQQVMKIELFTDCCQREALIPLVYQYDAYPFIESVRNDLTALGFAVSCSCTGNNFINPKYPPAGSNVGLH